MLLKHVIWRKGEEGGRVAVKLDDDDYLHIVRLSGPSLPVRYLLAVLNAAIPDWAERAEKLHRQRGLPWTVARRVGSSGCVDYFVFVLRDREYMDQIKTSHVHVSMYDKLNENLYIWLRDLAPIMAAMLDDYTFEDLDSCWAIEPRERDYQEPGASSGLLEKLEALKTMKQLEGGDGE